jgi:hypothetical protein
MVISLVNGNSPKRGAQKIVYILLWRAEAITMILNVEQEICFVQH